MILKLSAQIISLSFYILTDKIWRGIITLFVVFVVDKYCNVKQILNNYERD